MGQKLTIVYRVYKHQCLRIWQRAIQVNETYLVATVCVSVGGLWVGGALGSCHVKN